MPHSLRLLRLFYVSRSTQAYTRDGLEEILQKSISNNERDGVTGLLCYKRRCFAQILEGEEQAVLRRFISISNDLRHRDVTLLSISLVNELLFSKWKMGYLGDVDLLDAPWEKIVALRASNEQQFGELMRRWLILLEPSPNPRPGAPLKASGTGSG